MTRCRRLAIRICHPFSYGVCSKCLGISYEKRGDADQDSLRTETEAEARAMTPAERHVTQAAISPATWAFR